MTEASTLLTRAPLRVVSGPGSIGRIRAELDRLHVNRPMLIHSASLDRTEIANLVQSASGASFTFADARAHTPVDTVRAAADHARHHAVDGLIALGGGSVSVTARAVAIALAEGGDFARLSTQRDAGGRVTSPRLDRPKLPIVTVPTTPSTAHVKAGTAVTTPGRAGRFAMFDPKTRSSCVILDPEALATAPETLVRAAGLNAFVMAVEGMTTRRANPISQADLAQAMTMLTALLPHIGEAAGNEAVRTDLAIASVLAGTGTDGTGGGLTAALSHTIGHHTGSHNGLVDAIVLPHVLSHMVVAAPASLLRIAALLHRELIEFDEALSWLFSATGAPSRLRDIGVDHPALESLSREAMEDFAVRTAGCTASAEILLSILERAW